MKYYLQEKNREALIKINIIFIIKIIIQINNNNFNEKKKNTKLNF